MKHFIGGCAVGLVVAVVKIPSMKITSKGAAFGYFLAHAFVGVSFGLAAWGLLP